MWLWCAAGAFASARFTTYPSTVSYAVSYPDALDRVVASANYGTNGADAFTRPDTIPARSDTVLVNSTAYNDAGEAAKAIDPQET